MAVILQRLDNFICPGLVASEENIGQLWLVWHGAVSLGFDTWQSADQLSCGQYKIIRNNKR